MSLMTRVRLLSGLRRCQTLNSPFRQISTSNKKSDAAVHGTVKETAAPEATTTRRQWMSYGFNPYDEKWDTHVAHGLSFMVVTVVFVFGSFIMAYRPENINSDWGQREAFLELRRRESLGLPLIDPNYIPVDKIKLPTDEELGDAEIFI